MSALTRRRAITVIAAACSTAFAAAPAARPRFEWNGTALGAEGRLIFIGLDGGTADRMVADVIAEIDRLEQVFSLYRADSEVSRLNREARLDHPSHDFLVVLEAALDMWRRSDGAFNPAIQPYWRALAGHFAGAPNRDGPDAGLLSEALALCNPDNITVQRDSVSLAPGMALTFNGIAQGYITDRVVALLRRNGLRNTLVQLGETRALPGRPWQVEIAGTGRTIDLRDCAIATSAGSGTPFSGDGRWHHLIDPRTGLPCGDFKSVTVCAASAMSADALSTALAVVGHGNAARIAGRFADVKVFAERSEQRPLTGCNPGSSDPVCT